MWCAKNLVIQPGLNVQHKGRRSTSIALAEPRRQSKDLGTHEVFQGRVLTTRRPSKESLDGRRPSTAPTESSDDRRPSKQSLDGRRPSTVSSDGRRLSSVSFVPDAEWNILEGRRVSKETAQFDADAASRGPRRRSSIYVYRP